MKCVLYLRVSTDDQHRKNQLPALEEYAATHGYEIVATYQESESAWRSGRQTELERLKTDCRDGKLFDVSAILIWSLDRLSRQGISHLTSLINLFAVYHLKILSKQQLWLDTEGPMRELMVAVFAFCSQYESILKSANTKSGLARARSEGKHLGRPPGSKDGHKHNRRGYLLRYADSDQ